MKGAAYKLPCGCVVARGSERIIEMCSCCESEFNERHERAIEDRQRRAPASLERVLAPGGLPVSLYQSNIRAAVHPGVPEDVQ